MDRSVSKDVSARSACVSKRGILSLVLALVAMGISLVFGPAAAFADDGSPSPSKARSFGDKPGAGAPQVEKPEIILGCFSDADCIQEGICVRDEGAPPDDPGDCLPSFDDEGWDPGASGPEQPRETLQCASSPGRATGPEQPLVVSLMLSLCALALARRGRR